MPYPRYGKLSREDVEAIVAYIRTLKPIEYTPPPRELGMPLPLVVRTMPAAGDVPSDSADDRSRRLRRIHDQRRGVRAIVTRRSTIRASRSRAATTPAASSSSCPAAASCAAPTSRPTPTPASAPGPSSSSSTSSRPSRARRTATLTAAEQRENTMMPWIGVCRHDARRPGRDLHLSPHAQARRQSGAEAQLSRDSGLELALGAWRRVRPRQVLGERGSAALLRHALRVV